MNDIKGYAQRLAAVAESYRLVGAYVHGSAALGGFQPARSDVDILIVIEGALPRHRQQALGDALLGSAYPCPGKALELSVITRATAADLGDCAFEVHVASPDEVVAGFGHEGDNDLILYAEVCRRSALTVAGPAAADVFGAVPRARLLRAIDGELGWGLEEAPFEYAVLNACRAIRFTVDGALTSKIDGGEWFRANHGDLPVVRAALVRQRGDDVESPPAHAVAAFVTAAREIVANA